MIYIWVLFFVHIPFMVNRTFNTCQPRGCNNISFSQRTTPIAHSFCEGCIWHDLHILGTASSKTLSSKCTKFHTVAE